uniref:Uncharacterized protein n=1 Tax=Anguilla anguilla TaxID=7936 RepID=A0A0E9W3I0_ANGAN
MSTVLTRPAVTTETVTCSWIGSMCITMKPLVESMCHVQSWSIWSQGPWTL